MAYGTFSRSRTRTCSARSVCNPCWRSSRAVDHTVDSGRVSRATSTISAITPTWPKMIWPPIWPLSPITDVRASGTTMPIVHSTCEKLTSLPRFLSSAASAMVAIETGRSAPVQRPARMAPISSMREARGEDVESHRDGDADHRHAEHRLAAESVTQPTAGGRADGDTHGEREGQDADLVARDAERLLIDDEGVARGDDGRGVQIGRHAGHHGDVPRIRTFACERSSRHGLPFIG